MNKNAGLIKFGTYEHMKAFYEKGEMYFNTFEFFKNLEDTGDGRADKNEYCSCHYAGDDLSACSLKIFPDGHPEQVIEPTKENGLLSFTLDFGNDKKYTHLYSFSCIKKQEIIESDLIINPKNFAPSKNYAVIISDCNEFASRFTNIIKESYKASFKLSTVEYVNKNIYSGEMGPFKKFDDFSYQNEVRIAIDFKTNKPQVIYLGSLEDIAREPVNKKDFYNMKVKIEHRNSNGKLLYTSDISNKSILNDIV